MAGLSRVVPCHTKSLQLCLTATPWTAACQASRSMGFSRQGYWSGLPCLPPGDLPNPGIKLASLALAGGFFTTSATWEVLLEQSFCVLKAHSDLYVTSCDQDHMALCMCAQSWPTLGDPMDCSQPGSSVHGILQARILEWVAMSFSRGPSQPRD